MFYSEEELKVAEKLAWEMLDGCKHAYMPNLERDYVYFYYKGKLVMDPWMNEDGQELPWPDHEDPRVAVDPVKYYGVDTIENYLTALFLKAPEAAPEITERIKAHINADGLLVHYEDTMPVIVNFAMTKEQAREEHDYECVGEEFPDSGRIYQMLENLPEGLVYVKERGWSKEIIVEKKNIKKLMRILYPEGTKWDYMKAVNRIEGKTVRIVGFGD